MMLIYLGDIGMQVSLFKEVNEMTVIIGLLAIAALGYLGYCLCKCIEAILTGPDWDDFND